MPWRLCVWRPLSATWLDFTHHTPAQQQAINLAESLSIVCPLVGWRALKLAGRRSIWWLASVDCDYDRSRAHFFIRPTWASSRARSLVASSLDRVPSTLKALATGRLPVDGSQSVTPLRASAGERRRSGRMNVVVVVVIITVTVVVSSSSSTRIGPPPMQCAHSKMDRF